MPLYEYQCKNKNCDTGIFEQYKPMKERKSGKCPSCGRKGSLLISKTRTIISFREGYDPGLGKYFSTQRDRDGFVEENNLRRVRD